MFHEVLDPSDEADTPLGLLEKLVLRMRAADIVTYRKGGLDIELDEVDKIKVKRKDESGGGAS